MMEDLLPKNAALLLLIPDLTLKQAKKFKLQPKVVKLMERNITLVINQVLVKFVLKPLVMLLTKTQKHGQMLVFSADRLQLVKRKQVLLLLTLFLVQQPLLVLTELGELLKLVFVAQATSLLLVLHFLLFQLHSEVIK